jgi:hypothetical protein
MSKVIIGVHGLANKPEESVLKEWWRTSLVDGLSHIGAPATDFEFDLAYWASSLYKNHQHTDPSYSFDSLYNGQPYQAPGTLKSYEEGWLDDARAKVQGLGGSVLDFATRKLGENPVQKYMLGKLLKDLAFYYDPARKLVAADDTLRPARAALDAFVTEKLRKHAGKEIMLIAHSMGSIISYNALRDIGQTDAPVTVARLVTIGSPLGLPYVKGKILEERAYDPTVRTPSVVSKSWTNFADKDDPVALDEQLRDDYKKNKSGIRVTDDLIYNDYCAPNGERNPHKSYGYLRAPELSKHVQEFLES